MLHWETCPGVTATALERAGHWDRDQKQPRQKTGPIWPRCTVTAIDTERDQRYLFPAPAKEGLHQQVSQRCL